MKTLTIGILATLSLAAKAPQSPQEEALKKVSADLPALIKAADADGNGTLSEREKTAMGWAEEGKLDGLFLKADADKNGEATKDEIAAALAAITGIKVKKV